MTPHLVGVGLSGIMAIGCAEVTYHPDTAVGAPVQIYFESTKPGAVLYQRVGVREGSARRGGRTRWYPVFAPVCEAPCEATIARGSPVYVGGEGIGSSSPLTLDPALEGPMTVKTSPGSSTLRGLGLAGVFTGFAAFGIGGWFAGAGELVDRPKWVAPGAVTSGVGLGIMIAGAVVLWSSRTTVDVVRAFLSPSRSAAIEAGEEGKAPRSSEPLSAEDPTR